MGDRKSERLINLTLALLASKRFLKKDEIFNNVAGYEGTAESKNRMFERDKSDLRSLGIEIEVGDLDSYFEDEPGYRIRPSDFNLDLPDLTPKEMAIFSIAANFWNGSIFAADAQTGLRKLRSTGVPVESGINLKFRPLFEAPTTFLANLQEAIEKRSAITFRYDGVNLESRSVFPYRIFLWKGFWYFVGLDTEKNAIRTFKGIRVEGDIELSKKKNQYEIPADLEISLILPKEEGPKIQAKFLIRRGEAAVLRNSSEFLESGDDEDLFSKDIENIEDFIRSILWHGTSVRVVEPQDLVARVIQRLESASN